MTPELFREILNSIEGDIEILEIEKTVSEGEDVPTQAEKLCPVTRSTDSRDFCVILATRSGADSGS
jgi:hypothetical protein